MRFRIRFWFFLAMVVLVAAPSARARDPRIALHVSERASSKVGSCEIENAPSTPCATYRVDAETGARENLTSHPALDNWPVWRR